MTEIAWVLAYLLVGAAILGATFAAQDRVPLGEVLAIVGTVVAWVIVMPAFAIVGFEQAIKAHRREKRRAKACTVEAASIVRQPKGLA